MMMMWRTTEGALCFFLFSQVVYKYILLVVQSTELEKHWPIFGLLSILV